MLKEALIKRGRAGEGADGVLVDAAKYRIRVKDRLRKDRRAHHQGRKKPGLIAKAMKEGEDDEEAISLTEPRHVRPIAEGTEVLRMRRDDALRRARRPRGEEDIGG